VRQPAIVVGLVADLPELLAPLWGLFFAQVKTRELPG